MDKGNCYKLAWDLFFSRKAGEGAMLVHGLVHGQGEAEGKVFGHAWVEVGEVVFDPSVQPDDPLVIVKDLYYKIGVIDRAWRFDFDGALREAERAGHYGPWPEKIWQVEREQGL